jgi:type IV pilus assembly protein PilX
MLGQITSRNTSAQRGSALIVSLVFLLLLTILGVTAMRSSVLQERMAGNTRDTNLAFQAAETALRAGENILNQNTLPTFNNSTAGYRNEIDKMSSDYWSKDYEWESDTPKDRRIEFRRCSR